MSVTYNKPNKYDYVTRKAFDRYCDLIDRRRQREVKDHRADLQAMIHRMINLEQALQDLADHVAQHCTRMDPTLTHAVIAGKADTRDS